MEGRNDVKNHRFFSEVLAIAAISLMAIPAQAYEAGSVAGGGSIEGAVIYRGNVPTKKIIPTKDVQVCGQPREDPLILVGSTGAVESAIVYLVGVASGKEWPPAQAAAKIDNVKCRFEPQVQVVPVGNLDVVNSDPVLHNTHGYYGKRTVFNMALPNQGQVIPTELPRPGTVRVDCDAHGWMEGWIHVVDNPYYAITGADGRFSITDVPPGDYKLVALQPFTGPMEMSVSVKGGEATNLEIELKKQ